MKSTPRILVLYEGDPFVGTRGGDVYSQHLLTRLNEQAELVVVNRDTLGIRGVATGTEYANAMKKYLADTKWRSGVLLDGSSFYVMSETNRMLKAEGWGPIVSVLQEWLPAREQTLRARQHLMRYMLRFVHSVDAHVAVSNWLKQRLVRLGVSSRNIDVARPGVPATCFESAAAAVRTPSAVLRIVSAGVYHPSKGQLLLVEALGELAKSNPTGLRNFRVDMYGAMPSDSDGYVKRLRQRISELQIGTAVHLHEQIEQAQLWEIFGTSDVFTFMANGEGLPLVVLESMLHGCVPVVSRGSPMVELLAGGKFGMGVAPNPAAVASALETIRLRLVTDQSWSTDIARVARVTTLRWNEAVDACAKYILARMGIE